MMPITSFDELYNYRFRGGKKWVYVLLFNPLDITKAGTILLHNLDLFDFDSGSTCDFFIPGFFNEHTGEHPRQQAIARELRHELGALGDDRRHNTYRNQETGYFLERLGNLGFNQRDFGGFYKTLQEKTKNNWSYSGECELLLFNFDQNTNSTIENFISYNLDDIVRNGRNISQFLRGIIETTARETNIESTKNKIDELFASLIFPASPADNYDLWITSQVLFEKHFAAQKYVFLSYSSKDIIFVSTLRNCLELKGIKCWMAPYDIPRGTNYAYMIEHAIKNTGLFVLLLSKNVIDSVWVGKELNRAITFFQRNEPNKLCVCWLDETFDLSGTAFAIPLEDIQISIEIKNNIDNYALIAAEYEEIAK